MATDSDPPPAAWTARRARPGEIGPELAARLEADRIEAAALAEAQALEDDDGLSPPPETMSMPNLPTEAVPVRLTAADYAAMARSYEADPPRRGEMVGEPFIATRDENDED